MTTPRTAPNTQPHEQHAAKLLATAAAIAAGTHAYGDARRFDNDTGYDWYYNALDVTRSAADQTFGSATGTSVYLDYFSDFYPAFTYYHSYTSGPGAQLWNSGFSNRYASPFGAGDSIGPGMSGGTWNSSSTLEFYWHSYDYYSGDSDSGARGLIPFDGSPAYIGLRLSIDGAQHYGWIGLTNNSGYIEAFAWGYETDAGVAVAAGAVPSPGALGLLAVGAVGALGRRGTRKE